VYVKRRKILGKSGTERESSSIPLLVQPIQFSYSEPNLSGKRRSRMSLGMEQTPAFKLTRASCIRVG
jgi:hypothetical protein